MPRTVKCALIQCSNAAATDLPIEEIKRLNIEKHLHYIEDAAKQGVQILLMQEVAKEHGMVIIVPIYEEELTGIYYNTAAVIDADGKYLGKYRKNHIPHV